MALPTILIAGGYDKATGYDEFAASLPGSKIVGMVELGDTADQIETAARAQGFTEIEHAGTMTEAVRRAYAMAHPGYNVLLSPASASFDMFKDYEERGRVFKQIAMEIAAEVGLK